MTWTSEGWPRASLRLRSLVVAAVVGIAVVSGCKQNPFTQNAFTLQNELTQLQAQQTQLAQRNQELQTRANTLDQDNQELEALLAQSRQQAQRLEDHLALVRDQLRSAASQLAQATEDKQATEQKAQAMLASTRRRGDVSITPNNSLAATLPAINLPGVEVRHDRDVVRIELPADRLFEQGTARMTAGSGMLIDAAVAEIVRLYPNQKIGVEGHTDTDTMLGAGVTSSHQLSASRAAAVHEYLISRGRFPPTQLFLVGHGPNHPVVSNATPAGKARNRRVELVVYPETAR